MSSSQALTPADFGAFFKAVHGFAPFPWQQRLVERVDREGAFPASLKLPTGSGKTATLDIALFCLALDAARPPAERRNLPRRIALVVDRRLIVDQTFDRAGKIAEALASPEAPVVEAVAALLAGLSSDEIGSGDESGPVGAVQLRGGVLRDNSWADRPDRPLLIASTVDQVGSRLLFRGYGVSDGLAPIHAGLLGRDTLVILDEVHLSEPFRQTLEGLTRRTDSDGRGVRVLEMSATPKAGAEPFELDDADRAHPLLARRLNAVKAFELESVTTKKTDAEAASTQLAGVMAGLAAEMIAGELAEGALRTVAVIANRVATARKTYQALRKAKVPAILMTGRMRPLDRSLALDQEHDRLIAGRERSPDDKPLVVVATQCLEAGADFDFDGLITEVAALDALKQRFGRVDRLGNMASAGMASRSLILATTAALADDDPIYGSALKATWERLQSLDDEARDFGAALPPHPNEALLSSPKPNAPTLTEPVLDLFCQTRPRPWADPEPAVFLHGNERTTPEVKIVWRAELDRLWDAGDDSKPVPRDAGWPDSAIAALEACPPAAGETLSVPLWAAERWLRTEPDERAESELAAADVEGAPAPAAEDRRRRPVLRRRLRWIHDRRGVTQGDLVPGETLIVPRRYGGLDPSSGCWDPADTRPVRDLGTLANADYGRVVLRLTPDLLVRSAEAGADADGATNLAAGPSWPTPPSPTPESAEDDSDEDRIATWLEACRATGDPELGKLLDQLEDKPAITVIEHPEPWFVIRAKTIRSGDFDNGGDSASFVFRKVLLSEHLQGVEHFAGAFAGALGLSPELVSDLALAGRLHDLGKADPRFQVLLHGDELAAATEGLIAKSAMPPWHRRARQRAQQLSGYPRGTRHELLSVAFAEAYPELLEAAHDSELVLHLVASHHGWCRPFAPEVEEPEDLVAAARLPTMNIDVETSTRHGLARMDAGLPSRFWNLNRRYGRHRLAWLESILRLADHRRSEAESRGAAKVFDEELNSEVTS